MHCARFVRMMRTINSTYLSVDSCFWSSNVHLRSTMHQMPRKPLRITFSRTRKHTPLYTQLLVESVCLDSLYWSLHHHFKCLRARSVMLLQAIMHQWHLSAWAFALQQEYQARVTGCKLSYPAWGMFGSDIRPSMAHPAMCGHQVIFHLRLERVDGTKEYI